VILALRAAVAGAQGSVSGTVYDSLGTHGPLANATVVLVERDRYATTDARGRFRFDSVADGSYTIGFSHPVLDSLDLQVPAVPVTIARGAAVIVTLSTPSAATAYAGICPNGHETGTGVIFGRVRDVDSRSPIVNAAVSSEWTEYSLILGGGRSTGHKVRETVRTGRGGVYVLCRVPIQVPLDLRAEQEGFAAGPAVIALNERLIRRLDLAVSQKDAAAKRLAATGDSAKTGTAVMGTATLHGVVRGGDGRPTRDAIVGVIGTDRSARTDGAGAFLLEKVPAGTRTVEVRLIGFQPLTFLFDFATNAARDTVVTFDRQAQELKAVTVKAKENKSLMEQMGFSERRSRGLGTFVTDSQLAKHDYSDLAGVFAVVHGLRLEYGTGHGMKQQPTPLMRGTGGGNCIPNFYVDNMQFPVKNSSQFGDLMLMVQPDKIKGIEVYSTSGTIPMQYDQTSSTGCGSVVIWTR
jgi:hypothetical protein